MSAETLEQAVRALGRGRRMDALPEGFAPEVWAEAESLGLVVYWLDPHHGNPYLLPAEEGVPTDEE